MNDTRRVVLKVMLGALGLAALCGVGALLVPGVALEQATGTAIAAAVTAGLMMVFASWVDKPQTRAGGLIGIVVCVSVFVGVCALIWLPRGMSWVEQFVSMSLANLAVCGLLLAAFVREKEKPEARLTWFLGAGACVVSMLGMEGAIFFMSIAKTTIPDSIIERWVFSVLFFAAASVLGSVCLVGWRVPRRDGGRTDWLMALAAIGVFAGAVGLGLALWGVWTKSSGNPWVIVLGYLMALMGAVTQFTMRTTVPAGASWLRYASLGTLAAAAGLIVVAVYIEDDPSLAIGPARMAIAMSVLWTCSALAILVIQRLGKREAVELTGSDFARVALTCPRCRRAQEMPTGPEGALCLECKLHIRVQVHSARCGACGYDLQDLRTARCPECGAGLAVGTA